MQDDDLNQCFHILQGEGDGRGVLKGGGWWWLLAVVSKNLMSCDLTDM